MKKNSSLIYQNFPHFRYVDDTFAMFRNEEESENFFKQPNCLHPFLKLTFEKEKNNCLPFLDVTWNEQLPVLKLVCIKNLPLLDSIYVGNLSVPLNKKQTLYQLSRISRKM